MLFIIEGVDMTGKTTLAEGLEREIGRNVDVRHCAQLRRHPLDEYEYDLDGYGPGLGYHVIYDRHLIGEDVYGPMYRGGSAMDVEMRWHIEAYLNSRGAVLVHLTHDVSELQRRHNQFSEDYLQFGDVGRALDRFKSVVRSSSIIHKVELTDPTPDDIDSLIRLGQRVEHEAVPVLTFPTYVGPPRPRYLLLGERRGGNPKYAAAFVPHKATSGHYLIGALPWRVADSIGLANACEENVLDLWKALGEPSVATLGALAHNATTEYGVPHGRAPHPQYVRRFHHRSRESYGHIVIEAVAHHRNLSDWRPR